jgi:hypothetical protein
MASEDALSELAARLTLCADTIANPYARARYTRRLSAESRGEGEAATPLAAHRRCCVCSANSRDAMKKMFAMKRTAITSCLTAVFPLLPAFAGAAVADRWPCAITYSYFPRCGPTSSGLVPNLLTDLPGEQDGALSASGEVAGKGGSTGFGFLASSAVVSLGAPATAGTTFDVPLSTPYAFSVRYSEGHSSVADLDFNAVAAHAETRGEPRDSPQLRGEVARVPGSYTLLLAGLGLVGIMAKRRLQNLI